MILKREDMHRINYVKDTLRRIEYKVEGIRKSIISRDKDVVLLINEDTGSEMQVDILTFCGGRFDIYNPLVIGELSEEQEDTQ